MGLKLVHYSKAESGNVDHGSDAVYLSNPVPAEGEDVLLKTFGATDLSPDGVIACACIEWGSDEEGWQFIRSVSGGSREYDINKDFTGDGEKRFRITRKVMTDGQSANIDYWMDYAARVIT